MAKKVISLAFIYARETKNFHVYNLADEEYPFYPKKVHISKKDAKDAAKKVTLNIILEV